MIDLTRRSAPFALAGLAMLPFAATPALADFNAAIQIDPGLFQAYGNRALVYRRMGRADLAMADLRRLTTA